MKTKFTLLIIFISIRFFSQNIEIKPSESIETDFEKTLKSIDDIVYYNFVFVNSLDAKEINYKITLSEYLEGINTQKSIIFESNYQIPSSNFQDNKLPFSLMGKYENDDIYKVLFSTYNSYISKKLFKISKEDKFNLKMFLSLGKKLELNKKVLLCAIIKPIKIAENIYRDCDFNSSIDEYEDWYTIFGLDKYYTFEIEFSTN